MSNAHLRGLIAACKTVTNVRDYAATHHLDDRYTLERLDVAIDALRDALHWAEGGLDKVDS